jgi:hypothetical protein
MNATSHNWPTATMTCGSEKPKEEAGRGRATIEQHKIFLHQIIYSNSNHYTCQRFKLCGKKICENVVLNTHVFGEISDYRRKYEELLFDLFFLGI